MVLPEVVIEDLPRPLTPLAYVTEAAFLTPQGLSTPAGFAMIPAVGRKVPSLRQAEIWDLVLGGWDLQDTVTALTNIGPGPDQGTELMGFLNRRWWRRHENGGPLDEAAGQITSKIEGLIRGGGRPQRRWTSCSITAPFSVWERLTRPARGMGSGPFSRATWLRKTRPADRAGAWDQAG